MKTYNHREFFFRSGLILTIASAGFAWGATSEITPPEKRRAVVESAVNLAKPAAAPSLPDNLAVPFSPPGFELSDAEERAAAAAASGIKNIAAPKLISDREILEQIASKIPPTGTMFAGDEALLTFGNKTVKIGGRLTVTLNGQDHHLEVVKIERTTFTLRFNREEITRPINPAKSP